MKKISLYILLALIFIAAGCKEDIWNGNNSDIKVRACFADSRSAIAQKGDVLHVSWNVDDAIALVPEKNTKIKYKADFAGSNADFSPYNISESLNAEEGKNVYAFYPYSDDIMDFTFSLPDLSVQGNGKTVGDFDAIYASSTVDNKFLNLNFKHIFAFVKLSFKSSDLTKFDQIIITSSEKLNNGKQGRFNLSTAQIIPATNSGDSQNSITYKFTANELKGVSDFTCYIVINPQTANASFNISAENSASGERVNLLTKQAPSNGMLAGKAYDLTVTKGSDREALIALYNSAGGDNWVHNENWCTDKPLDDWFGVDTKMIDGEERVDALILQENNLHGELPLEFGNMDKMTYLAIYSNSLTGSIPVSFYKLKKLKQLYAYNNYISGTLDNEICYMKELETISLGDNRIGGEIPVDLGNLTRLNYFRIYNNNFTGNIPESVINLTSISNFYIYGNRLSGTIPDFITKSDFWKKVYSYNNIMVQQQGYNLTYTMYRSSDYSKDGEIITLQKSSAGNGIDLIFMGDGFIDKDMDTGGKYEQKMKEALEQFFYYEPYKSFRNRFNAYAIKIVSKNEDWIYGAKHAIDENTNICLNYAKNLLGSNAKHPYISVIYNVKTDQVAGRSYTNMWTDGTFVSFMMENSTNQRMVLTHEACGHGFAKLMDEYVENSNSSMPESEKNNIDNYHSIKWGLNVDYRNSPSTVAWSRFLSDSRYDVEGLGVYQGSFLYEYGAYRSSENSMMRYNDSPFNAPSREAIYNAIMSESEENWVENHEEFVKYDEKNIVAPRSRSTSTSNENIEKHKRYHRSPMLIHGSWKIELGKDNINVPLK